MLSRILYAIGGLALGGSLSVGLYERDWFCSIAEIVGIGAVAFGIIASKTK